MFWNSHTKNFEISYFITVFSLPQDNQLSNRLFSGSAQKGKNIQKFRNFFKDLGKPKLLKFWASTKTDFKKNVRECPEIVWICQET